VAGKPPEEIREAVFARAALARKKPPFERAIILAAVAGQLGVTESEIESGLFADLKSEQRLVRFEDVTPERLLNRYNLALAQGILLKSVRVTIDLRREAPARLRVILRRIKFHRLVCTATATGPESCRLVLEGPLSLFSATQKYGVQLASFLTAVTPCRDFDLYAELLWGTQRKPKVFTLTHADGLDAEAPGVAARIPVELEMFAMQFRKKIGDWHLIDESAVLPLGDSYWAPDFRLEHLGSGKVVYLEVLGYWRRSGAEQRVRRLREHAPAPFLLAASENLNLDDGDAGGLPASILRFRQMPLPSEVAERAAKLLGLDT
jgi:uncharacterized protein